MSWRDLVYLNPHPWGLMLSNAGFTPTIQGCGIQSFSSGCLSAAQGILPQGSVPSPVQPGFGFIPLSALIPVTPSRPLPWAALQSVAMGKKTGKGGFGEWEINGYQEVS